MTNESVTSEQLLEAEERAFDAVLNDLYPDYVVWMKKVKGYFSYPSWADIRSWYVFLKEGIKEKK